MYESAPWRTELRKFAATVRDAPLWPSEDVPFELERALLYSAVVLRKLIEDRKVTDELSSKVLTVITYKASAPAPSSVRRNSPGSVEFDWTTKSTTLLTAKELCSQIVHFFGLHCGGMMTSNWCGARLFVHTAIKIIRVI